MFWKQRSQAELYESQPNWVQLHLCSSFGQSQCCAHVTEFAFGSAGNTWLHIQLRFCLFIQIHQRENKYSYTYSQNPLKYMDVKTKSMIWMYEDMEGEDEGEDEDVIVEIWIALCWCKWRRKPVWKVAWAFAYASMQIKGLSGVIHLHRDISDAMGTRQTGAQSTYE